MADNFDILVSADTSKAESEIDKLTKQKRKIDIDAELNTSEVENQLKQLSNRKIQLDIEVGTKDQASKIAKDIERGLKNTKIDASAMAKSLADSFNISNKSIVKKMQTQINGMMSDLSSTWDGKKLDLTKASGFYDGIDELGKTVSQNAKIIESKLGIYDKFYDYAKNKRIFVSDDLKKALGTDEYKELLKNNVGKITKDATKGLSIDSLWGELTTSFPEHFSDTIANQADQIRKYFDVLKSARADITKMISTSDMTPQQLIGVSDDAFQHVVDLAGNIRDKLVQNLNDATEKSKTTFDLDVEVNTEKIVADIRNAIKGASSGLDDSLNIDIKLNDEEIASQIRSAVNKIGNGDEDITVDIKVDRQSLQADINAALNDLDLPIHFNIDAAELEADIRKAVDNITDISIDLKVDADSLRKEAEDALGNIDPLESYRESIKTARQTSTNTGIFDNDYMSKLSSTAGRVFDVFVAANAYDWGGDKIRDAISDLRELNTTLVEIDKTGNLTSTQLKELGENSFDNASKWGSVVQDYLSSSETFAQAGFENLEEMSDLSTMAQVAGQMTQEVATNFLIASDAAWQMKGSAEQLTSVLDGMNMVTNKNALQMTDLANGVRVAGSMLANSGLTQGEVTSLLGTGIATTKEAGETVARGVRTIIMNLREIKGETEDGEIIDETQLKKVELLCNDLGVSLKNVRNGIVELRNPIDILRDLSQIYNSLDTMDARRADITDTIGGKYRSNILSAILTNFDLYDKMLQDYASGSGSMVNEAMKTADSWQGLLNSLSNQWTEFVSGFMDTEYIKGSISGLEGMIVAMDKLNDAQLFIPTMLSSIMGLRNMFTGKGLTDISISKDGTGSLGKLDLQGSLFGIDFTKMGQWKSHFAEAESLLTQWNQSCLDGTANMKTFGGSFVSENKHFKNYISTVKDGSASLEGYKKSLASTGVQFQKFSVKSILANAATGFIAGVGIELAVAGITKLIDYVAHADDKVREAAENARSEWDSAKSDIESTNQELETTQQKIDALKAKGSLSLVEQQELANLQRQNAELERTLQLQQDIEEYKHNEAKNSAKDSLEAKKKYEFNTDENGFYTGVTRKVTTQEAVDKYISEIERMQKEQSALKEEMYNLDTNDDNFEFDYETYQQQIADYESAIGATKEKLSDAYNELNTDISLFYDSTTGKIEIGMDEQVNAFLASQKKMDAILGNTASSKESAINTLFAKKQFSSLQNSFIEAAQTGESAIKSLINETPGISDVLDKAGVSVDEFVQHFMALGNPNALKLDEVKKQLKEAFSGDLGDNATYGDYKNYDERARQFNKFLQDKTDEEIEIFYKYVNDGDIDLSELTLEDIEELFITVNADTTEAQKSLDELTQSANNVVSSINSINSVLSSQGTGKSISSDIFSNEELKDYSSALEYVNGCYQLNTEKVKELTEAKVDEAIATNNTKKAIEQQNYLKNAKEIDSLRKKIEENNFVGDENAETIQSQIDSLLEQNSAIISNCNQLDVLNASLRESIGVYQQWKDAQSAGNSGDMFDDAGTAWSQIRDIADKESDMYGRVGTVQYQAAVDFLVPEEIDHSDQKAVQKYLDGIKKYMYFDDNGDVNGINMDEFFKSAVDKGLMVETEDSYEIAGQMTMQKFAEGMGMSLPLVQAIFGEIEEFMPEGEQWFDWSDEAVQSLGDLAIVASDAADALQSTEQFKNMDIQIDVSDLSTTEEQISALDATIAQMNQVKATPGVDTSQIEDANAIIQYCVQQKQALNEPAVMSVDTSMVEGQIGEAISLLQQFQQAQNELEMQRTLGLDTSEAESKVSNLTSEIQALNPKVTASLGIDPASTETIASTISALTPKMMVEAGVDDKAIIGYQAENKEATVTYDVDHSAVDAYNPQNLDRTVTYSVITQGNVPPGGTILNSGSSNKKKSSGKSGGSGANGTAHAYGTALADGVWGAKQGGMALVGELGREVIVDPLTGKWRTVGDNGAEFTYVPKHALVFNHLQTESLLKNGYITSRAQALVSGTAFASGNAMVTGSIPKNVTTLKNKKQTSTENTSSKSKESTTNNTKATDKNTTATNKNTEATENLQDWIEYSTNLQSKENDRLYNAIESFEMHANQNKAIDAYITDSQAYMNTLRNAQNAYMSKANALGLDSSYIHKIWAGDDLSLENVQDEALRDKIEKYQNYYEKSKELGDQMTELNQKIRETKISKLENIQDDYDNLVSYAEGIIDYNEAVNNLFESRNLVGNQDALMNNINQQMAIRQALVNEEKELTDQLNALVASGDIAEYTDTWLKWKTEINGVTSAIVEADSALEELKQSIMEIRYKSFEDSLNNLDFNSEMFSSIRDLMSQEGIYDDNVKLTDSGKTQLALMEQELISAKQKVANYNTAIEALAKDLAYGNITQSQFNEKLQEYQKDQMGAVKATKDVRDAILDLVKDGIIKESESVQELIQKRKDDLSLQKEYYDFQKKMNDKSKEMNKIRAELAAIDGNDDSVEIQQRRKRLLSQLQELEEEYNEELNDRKYDIVQDAYDKTNELTKENEEKALKELETNLDAQNEAIANALEVTKTTYQTVYDQLNMLAQQYNFTLTDSLTSPWLNAQSAIDSYQQAIGKVQSNVSIDTSKIQDTTPSQNQTVPTKNEPSTQNLDKSANGTWLKQGNQWWYQHADGSYTSNGWEQIDGKWYKFDQNGWMQSGWQPWGTDSTGQTAWYYMGDPNDGSMKTSTWVQGKDGKYYFVDHSGVMARNGYVKSANSGMYYWVNGDGVWEPQWNTYNPDLSKYKQYYNRGKKSVPYDTMAYTDDTPNHKLDLGSEVIITNKGVLREMNAGDMVFSKDQKEALWNLSKGDIPLNLQFATPSITDNISNLIQPKNNGGDVNVHYDTLIGNIEYVDKNALPDLETILKKGFEYNIKELRKYKKRL